MSLRLRSVALGAALPLALVGLAVAAVWSWLPRLPDPVAVHWGPDGVDRLGTVIELVLPSGVTAALLIAPLAVAACLPLRSARRAVVGLSAGLTTMVVGQLLALVHGQVDLPDATAAPSPGAALMLPLLGAVAAGAITAWLAGSEPPQPAGIPVPGDAVSIPLGPGRRALWHAPLSPLPIVVPTVVLIATTGVTVTVGVLTADWWALVVVGVVAVALALVLGWRARVDGTGLTLTWVLPWPRHHIPAGEVVRADVIGVSPGRDFGGWGIRVAVGGRFAGSLGFVTRSGDGIRVERTGGRSLVVTVPDADRGAALLNTVAARARERPRSPAD